VEQTQAKINAVNKIISVDALVGIFEAIEQADQTMKEAAAREVQENEPLIYQKQNFKAEGYRMGFNARVTLKNESRLECKTPRDLINYLKTRAFEAEGIFVFVDFHYNERAPEKKTVFHSEEIVMSIREQTFGVKYSMYNAAAVNQIIHKIQQTIAEAPEKMTDVMANQPIVISKIGLGVGLIPGMLLACIGFAVPQFRTFYGQIPGIFFLISLVLGVAVGILIAAKMVEPLYHSIVGRQRYAGYNKKTHQSMYRDDMDDYSSTAEVLIGSKVDGLRKRQKLDEYQKKFGKLILPELLVVLVASVIVYLVLHFFVG